MTIAFPNDRPIYDGRPAINRALRIGEQGSGQAAARARTALVPWLDNLSQSQWPRVAWQFSRLTADGFPFELVFSSLDPSIRYTVEVCGPEQSPGRRLSSACLQLSTLGLGGLPDSQLRSMASLQAGGSLKFGCWLGGRSSKDADRYKLYIETPPETRIQDWLNLLPGVPELQIPLTWRLHMVGCELAPGSTELYFAGPEINAWEITQLPRYIGLRSAPPELLDLVRRAFGRELPAAFPGDTTGWSLAFSPDGAVTYTFFLFAKHLGDDNGPLRDWMQQIGSSLSWDLSLYREIASPLWTDRRCLDRGHGMVAFSAMPDGRLGMAIGLRPPDPP
jgi:hypothetical protein